MISAITQSKENHCRADSAYKKKLRLENLKTSMAHACKGTGVILLKKKLPFSFQKIFKVKNTGILGKEVFIGRASHFFYVNKSLQLHFLGKCHCPIKITSPLF
jgi:hypothetical protein